jgi:GT2 family glycosyltransferase
MRPSPDTTPPTMTIIVPTFRRRDAVLRLLAAFAEQFADPQVGAGVDVLVVVDGSDDGTLEAVQELDYPVPMRAVYHPNAGIAATRNRGLREAQGEVLWMVDDDMVPAEGLVERHRRAHDGRAELFVMGPCLHPPDGVEVTGPIRDYAARWFGALAEAGEVTTAFDFSVANTSAPATTWRRVGGFEERLRGWGGEDYEYGLRALQAGVPVRFDREAVAWHRQLRTVREFCDNRRDQGRNFVRIAQLHPEAVEDLMPLSCSGRALRLLHRLSAGRARRYAAGAWLLTFAARVEARLAHRGHGRLLDLAQNASQIAGVAELDGDGAYVARYFAEPA